MNTKFIVISDPRRKISKSLKELMMESPNGSPRSTLLNFARSNGSMSNLRTSRLPVLAKNDLNLKNIINDYFTLE